MQVKVAMLVQYQYYDNNSYLQEKESGIFDRTHS